jgi:lipoprotein YgeR
MVTKQTRLISTIASVLALFILISASLYAENAEYIVQKGDNLYRISKKFNVSLDLLLSQNPHIDDPDKVREGTRIKIPAADAYMEHIVQAGENLYRLSLRYGVALDELLAANQLTEDSILKVGDKILVPGSFDAADPSSGDAVGVVSVRTDTVIEFSKVDPEVWTRGIPFWPHSGEIKPLEGPLYSKLSPGIEIAGEKGDPIVSVSSGTVEWASPYRGFGKIVLVKHHTGHNFLYGGIGELLVDVGDKVTVGTNLGLLGTNYHEGKALVFFWVSKDGSFFEPQKAPRD